MANVSVADKESDAINRFVCRKGVVSACMQYCSKYCNENIIVMKIGKTVFQKNVVQPDIVILPL